MNVKCMTGHCNELYLGIAQIHIGITFGDTFPRMYRQMYFMINVFGKNFLLWTIYMYVPSTAYSLWPRQDSKQCMSLVV